jgi:ferredoxin-NADP reductase
MRPGRRALVERFLDHEPDTRSLFLRVAGERPLSFIPGQFISISIPLADETRTRPYSIASSPEDGDPFEICFNRVPGGRGVDYLFDRRAGDELTFTGPFGLFTIDRPPDLELVFIAIGTGIAPIRPMLRRLLLTSFAHPVHLLYGAADEAHLLYREELERWACGYPSFGMEQFVPPPDSAPETIYDYIREAVDRRWVSGDASRARHFYICGVGPGVLKIRDLLRGSGYERRSVKYEQW